MFKRTVLKSLVLFLLAGIIFSFVFCFADESLTITTYYPSPYGVYNQLQTNSLGVGDNSNDGSLNGADVPVTPGDVWIRGNVGIGTTENSANLAIENSASRARVTISGAGDSWDYSELKLKKTVGYPEWSLLNRQYTGEVPDSFIIEERNVVSGIEDYKQRIVINPYKATKDFPNQTQPWPINNPGRIYLNPFDSIGFQGGVSIGSSFRYPDPPGVRLGDLHVQGGTGRTALVEFCGPGGDPNNATDVEGPNYVILTLEAYDSSIGYPHWSFLHRKKSDISGQPNGFALEYYDGTNYNIRWVIDRNGNMGIGTKTPSHLLELSGGAFSDGSTWTPGSDRAYKKEINYDFKYGLKEIEQLKPVYYVHKQDKENKTQIGFIAQDMLKIVPELVKGSEGSFGLSYDQLTAVLVKAVQEQQGQIEELKQRIAQLEKSNQSADLVEIPQIPKE